MEKESPKVFKNANLAEAKSSIIRSPKRDIKSIERDQVVLE
jgi:hypothetical protein